jgi:TRAP-type C4-dicarboxylate transport system permease large subunit
MVIAMGLGLFSPPIGVGLFATCSITGTRVKDVAGPMMKYLAVLAAGLIALILIPAFALYLPGYFGML